VIRIIWSKEMLWQSMRRMEETTMLLKNIGRHFEEFKNPEAAKNFVVKQKKERSGPSPFMIQFHPGALQ
jgi:hypothetical protein